MRVATGLMGVYTESMGPHRHIHHLHAERGTRGREVDVPQAGTIWNIKTRQCEHTKTKTTLCTMRSYNLGVHTCSPASSAVKYLRVRHDFMGTTFTMHVYLQCGV